MMQSSEERQRSDLPDALNGARDRRVLLVVPQNLGRASESVNGLIFDEVQQRKTDGWSTSRLQE